MGSAPPSFFHGPGESPDSRGLGRGVMSPIAAMTGLGMTLLVPADPMLLVRAALRLGVLDTEGRLPAEALRVMNRDGDRFLLELSESGGGRADAFGLRDKRSVDIRRGVAGPWEDLSWEG